MFGLETILGIIFEKIIEPVIQPVGRHAGFLLHYKRNLNNLEDEVNNLQEQRSDFERKVNEAKRQGDAIVNKVSVWLDDADKTSQEVEEFRDAKTVKENMSCFSFSCPNFISRYRLSKEAEKKVVRVKHLTEKGGNIGTVSHPREDPPEVVFRSKGNYECFHSRDKVSKDIVKALKEPEVNMIGVYGTGGVGKTTMVTNVAKQVKIDGTFDEVVIAVVSQDANVIKVQEQLAERLNLTLSEKTEMGRASRLWNRLDNGMKNLIILDDVWHELDLKEIGIPISDGNKSCKVVLTARDRDVWKNMDVDKDFKIEILIEKESWALFQKKVGNYVDADQELCEIAWAVCKECQGLPVAINAIGAALKNKDMYAWRDALDKLQNSRLNDIVGIDRKVYASLKLSYDMLDSEDAKSCFLLCCLFPEDARIPIDDLVRYYMAGRTFHHDQKPDSLERALYRVRTVVSTLISCCLLLESLDENYSDDVVKMHDVVRDVAISIAKGEKYSFLVKHDVKDWPEKATYEQCSVISLRPRYMREFPDELVCPSLNTLRLDCTNSVSRLQVPDRFFSGTENLMVLDLKSVTMSPILPASLAKLAKLQMLCLDGCKLGNIAILKDLKDHLEILSLRRSDIKVLPPEVGELTLLRVLDMDDCNELEVIPKGVISKLLRLEELYMPRVFSQWGRTIADRTGRDISRVSLDELMSLTRLTTLLHVCIRDPALLPKDFTFENLVRFDIKVCDEYASDYIYDKDSTGVLQLEKIHVANGLESLLGKPKPKWSIQRNGLYPSTSFYHLTCLRITDCRLKYLFSPSSARGLVQLKKLAIKRCMDMEGVIGNEGEEDHEDIIPISFSRLNELGLGDLPNLKSFYPKKEKKATSSESCSAHDAKTVLFTDKVILPVLKILVISKMRNIIEIWDKQSIAVLEDKGSFCQLTYVSIEDCDKLPLVFPSKMHPQLKNLENLVVEDCAAMEGIVEFEGEIHEDGLGNEVCFSKLSRLYLRRLPNLVRFCTKLRTAGTTDGNATIHAQPLFNEKVIFPVLEELTIDGLHNIIKIWDNQSIVVVEGRGSFCQLTTVTVYSCNKLMHVWSSKKHPLLKNLKELQVSNCGTMKSITEFEGEIDEDGLRNEVASPALEHLDMFGAPKITEIQDKQLLPQPIIKVESLCKLERIVIERCSQLLYVFPSNMLPQNLQQLEIRNCDVLEVIFSKELKEKEAINYDIIVFPQLKFVRLGNLPKLKSFYTETQGFFSHKVVFPVLEQLDFWNLDKITRIWDNQPLSEPEKEAKSFCQLMYIFVSRCVHLEYVLPFYMLPQLKNLQKLDIEGCTKMEVIISNKPKDQKEATINDTILFPQLKTVELARLPNLKSLCTETQLFFSNKDAFPVLETIELHPEGTLEFLRNEMASTKEISMEECGTSGKENDHNGEQG